MATTLRTTDGDVLDGVCMRTYGHLNGSVEAVLTANPGLADIAQPFPAGVLITLPDVQAQQRNAIKLWE